MGGQHFAEINWKRVILSATKDPGISKSLATRDASLSTKTYWTFSATS
jgi:hypothetical protein